MSETSIHPAVDSGSAQDPARRAAHIQATGVDLSAAASPHGWRNRLARVVWSVAWLLLFRISPRAFKRWRNLVLRLFGAQLHPTAVVYPSVRIWAPWNLSMDRYSCLADDVICYCLNRIHIGEQSVVSQYTYLCGGTHDFEHPHLPLVTAPIVIEDQVWVAADVFVAPGVRIGQGTVVGARSSVFSDLPPWKVCVGSPAKPIKDRVIKGVA